MRLFSIFGSLILVIGAAAATTIVKTEPPMGALKEGQVLLVDDGSCPTGQIKRVVGGNHKKVGGWKNIERERACVPKQ